MGVASSGAIIIFFMNLMFLAFVRILRTEYGLDRENRSAVPEEPENVQETLNRRSAKTVGGVAQYIVLVNGLLLRAGPQFCGP